MKFAPLLIALTLILSVSCSNKKGKTNVQFGRMFLNGAPTFSGGLGIFGKNDTGSFFTYTLTDDSTIPAMDIPNGNWTFWAVGWTSANKLEGVTKCGSTSALLEGGDIGVSMTLNQTNCGSTQLAAPAFINVDQFHPVVVSSCYLQTIVDDTTVCDNSNKGEHRSFRFKIDTISNFGALPSPQPIISNCFDEASGTSGSSTTTVTIPAGSGAGVPLNVIIEAFPNTGCTGTRQLFNMPKGFFGPGSQSKTFAGASQTKVYLDSILPTAGPINSIAYSNLSHANITTAFVDISFDFLDDDDSDSSAVVNTCNITVSGAGCSPTGATAMSRGASTYDKTFLSHSGSPGDEIKYNVVVTDPDGISAALPDQSFFVPVSAPTGLSYNSPVSSPANVTSPVFTVNGTISGGIVAVHTQADCSDASTWTAAGGAGSTNVGLSGLTDGSYTFYAKQTINAVESTCSSGSLSYTLDTVAPTDPTALSFTVPNPSNDNTPNVTASSLVVGDSIKFYTDIGCSVLNTGPVAISTSTEAFTLATLTDGGHDIYTKVYDAAGNGSSCLSVGATLYIDTVAPTAPSSLTGTNPSNDTTPDITVTHSDSTGTVSIYSDSGCSSLLGINAANGSNVIVTSSALTEGSYTIYADQTDAAGNKSTCSGSSFTYNLDTTAPSIVSITRVGSTPTMSGTINYTVVFSEALSANPVAGDFVHTTVSGGVTDAIGSITGGTTTYNVPVTISGGDALVRLDLNDLDNSITDPAGNILASNTYTGGEVFEIDNTAPTFLYFWVDDSQYYYVGDIVYIEATFSENVYDSGSQLFLSGGQIANYSSGAGSDTLIYQYTIQQSDSDMNVDNATSPAISSNVADLAGNLASITTPTPGSVGSIFNDFYLAFLGHGKALVGGAGNDDNIKTAVDTLTGDVYTAMTTTSSIADTLSGTSDVYITRRSADGTLIEEIQLGAGCNSWITGCNSTGNETVNAILFDDITGSLYVVGTTTSIAFVPNSGAGTGQHIWIMSLSFDPSYISPPTFDDYGQYRLAGTQVPQAFDLNPSNGDISIVGYSSATISCAYCSTGSGTGVSALIVNVNSIDLNNPIAAWTFGGTGSDSALGVKFDSSGNIFVVGQTNSVSGGGSYLTNTGTLGGYDLYAWKFSMPSMSPPLLQYRLNTAGTNGNETPTGISFDGINFIIYGYTDGSTFSANLGSEDYFIMTVDQTLTLQNSFQNGTSGVDRITDVTIDSFGDIYSVGMTTGALGGATNASLALDIFVHKFDPGLSDLGITQYDDNFSLLYDPTTPMSPNSIKILDDKYLIISATASSGGDVFGLGDAMGGTTDGALLMVRAP